MFSHNIFFNISIETTKNELREIGTIFNDMIHDIINEIILNDVYLRNGVINYINSLFTIFLVTGGSILLTGIIVSKIISFNYSDDLDNNYNEYIDSMSKEYDEDYVFKYDELFDKLPEIYKIDKLSTIEKNELKNKFTREKTPKGEIIMSYNWESDIWLSSFKYYCNDSSIPYSYLESVAKLYVSDHKCPYFFLTTKKIKNESDTKETNNTVNNDKPKIEPEKGIFASFKSYNTVKKTINTNSNTSSNTTSYDNKSTNKISDDNIVLLKNRFTRVGNIEDYDDMIKKELNILKRGIPIGFSEYKKLGMNK